MREWMNLTESQRPAHLYHGTSMTGFCFIAHHNMIGAYGGEDQASFTLDPEVAKRFCGSAIDLARRGQLSQYSDFDYTKFEEDHELVSHKAEMIAGGQGVVMEFNRQALHRDYEFFSVCFHSDGLEMVDFGDGDDELEECVFGDVNNLDRYITGLMIDRAGFARYCECVREALPNDAETMAVIAAGERWVQRFP
jgi:hypothetical protein